MDTNAIDANANGIANANEIDANANEIDANGIANANANGIANANAIDAIEVNDIELDFKSEQEQEPKKTNITSIILKCLEYSNDAYGVDDPNTKLQHKEFANSLFNRVNL